MVFIHEFEIVPDEGGFLALPVGMDGGTEGNTLEETVAMAVDWLRMTALDALLHGQLMPPTTFDSVPSEGGKMVIVAVDVELSDAPAMTAAQAAETLGVSTARVAQMCASGQLASWRVGSTRMVAVESVEERLALAPGPGRPRRTADREPVLA